MLSLIDLICQDTLELPSNHVEALLEENIKPRLIFCFFARKNIEEEHQSEKNGEQTDLRHVLNAAKKKETGQMKYCYKNPFQRKWNQLLKIDRSKETVMILAGSSTEAIEPPKELLLQQGSGWGAREMLPLCTSSQYHLSKVQGEKHRKHLISYLGRILSNRTTKESWAGSRVECREFTLCSWKQLAQAGIVMAVIRYTSHLLPHRCPLLICHPKQLLESLEPRTMFLSIAELGWGEHESYQNNCQMVGCSNLDEAKQILVLLVPGSKMS